MFLCNDCIKLDIRRLRADNFFSPVSYNVKKTEEAAKKGCRFCTLLFEAAIAMYKAHGSQLGETRGSSLDQDFPWLLLSAVADKPFIWWKRWSPPRHKKINLTLSKCSYQEVNHPWEPYHHITEEHVDFEICLAAAPNSLAYKSKIVGATYLGTNRDSPEFYQALNRWLHVCSKNTSTHRQCFKSLSTQSTISPSDAPLPTRCLEITEDYVRLAETLGDKSKYMTLSHRWHDNTASFNTTMSNYNQRLSGEIGELSKTFQHAITVARGLGIRYLWIDSLCIIQDGDDGVDWEQESKKMGQYYQNSILTIFAIAGDQDRGFLDMKPPRVQNVVQLPFFEKGYLADSAGKTNGHVYAFLRPVKTEKVYLSEVDRIFQEHMLSRRIVYFTDHETFVECASYRPMSLSGDYVQLGETAKARQRSDFNFKTKRVRSRLNHKLKKDVMHVPGGLGTRSGLDQWIYRAYDSWYNHVMDYSCTALTRPEEDHLRAISGIATETWTVVKDLLPKGYVSGLWLRDIDRGLLWRSRAPQATGCNCGAPSWSWLSLSSPVQWSLRDDAAVRELRLMAFWPKLPRVFDAVWMTQGLRVRGRRLELLIKGPDDEPMDSEGNHREQRYKTHAIRQRTGDLDREPDRNLFTRAGPHSRPRADPFYAVFSKTDPDLVAGWASIDESQYYMGESSSNFAGTVIACHVSTRRNVRQSSKSLQATLSDRPSEFRFINKVYDVLFIESVDGYGRNSYRRIGMGSLCGRLLLEQFDKQERETFHLV